LTIHEDEILGKAYDSRLMKRLLTYLWPYKKQTLIALLVLLCSTAGDLAGPYLLKVAIDRDIAARNLHGLFRLMQFYVLVLLMRSAANYTYTLLTNWLGQKIMFDLRRRLFAHIQKLPLAFFDRNPVGRLVTRVTNDVETLNQMLSSGIVAILGDIVVLVGIITIMLSLNWKLALVTFAVFPLIFLATEIFRKKVRQAYRQIRLRIARINSFLQENISGMTTVQLFNREGKNYNQFLELNDSHREANQRSIRYHAVYYPTIGFFTFLSTAMILWYGGLQVWKGVISIGILVAFTQYVRRFFEPIEDLADKYNIMQAAMASSERVFALMDEKEQEPFQEPQQTLPTSRGKIEFRNLSFAYNSEDWVLKDVSFTIQPGEKVAIVGATGAGKTSIISLLNRMYEPTYGQILLDDVDTAHVPLQEIRSRIGVVLQDVFIFSGSVRDNISLGDPAVTDEVMEQSASRVNAHRFIHTLPQQYEHELAERGSNLSTGQKQLLSFARALAFNPEILILDEATSSVDTETELLIREAIRKLMENRTSIIIAHRLSTIQHVDWIIVLHKGKIREMGKHQDLLAKKGVYYRLYQLQFENIEETPE
jgi:ATP-binding cassette, subfamily B, multidrug efflux pump